MCTLKILSLAVLVMVYSSCFSPGVSAQMAKGETDGFAWRVDPAYRYRSDGRAGRIVRIRLKDTAWHGPVNITVTCNRVTENMQYQSSDSIYRSGFLLPEGIGTDSAANGSLTIAYNNRSFSGGLFVPRLRKWTVFIYPHAHLDIGYTGLPADVQRIQVRNIDVGIDLAEKTQHYPEGARFVWNPEATWVVRKYLQEVSPEKKKRFADAVKKGWVQIDAGHSNINTSTCSDEELLQLFHNSTSISKETGVPMTTMVQMDLPGAAWGLVTAAAQFRVNRMISFPNNYDTRKDVEHRPFYWLGPDGKTKMLFLQGFPYGIGYTIKGNHYGLGKLQHYSNEYDRVQTVNPSADFLDPFIFQEIDVLERHQWPYDLFAMTWSMADNCVIDADLPDAVKAWNEKYAYPHLVISGSSGILDAYEKKYGPQLPVYRGDFTEFWTNGLGADAASVGEGRKGKEALIQAQTLWSMLQPAKTPQQNIDSAWENSLLSAEHTWGAQDSRSQLAREVEKIKSGYFRNAAIQSDQLIKQALSPYADTTANGFSIINTLSWPRTGVITLTKAQSRNGDIILDDKHKPVLSQRLSNGDLIFLASDIPALDARYYTLHPGLAAGNNRLSVSVSNLQNDLLQVGVDSASGTISSIKTLADGYEYVNSSNGGLNQYNYIPGVYNGKDYPKAPQRSGHATISIKEKGPLLVSLLVHSKAPGVEYLTSEIRLYAKTAIVEVTNIFQKIATRNKESIHMGFSFAVADGIRRMDMPWSIVSPNTDQLAGANKNWYTMQRWADVSGTGHGVTWSAIECPLVEWGEMSGNILDGARQYSLWKKDLAPSSNLYSFVLNNHWDTNFPLEQGGVINQSYRMQFHHGYNAVNATRFGMETNRPLLVVQAKKNIIEKPLVAIGNPAIILSMLKKGNGNKRILMRVRSVSASAEPLQLQWPGAQPLSVTVCNAAEEPLEELSDEFRVAPYGMATLQMAF